MAKIKEIELKGVVYSIGGAGGISYAKSTSAAATVEKVVSIPDITELKEGTAIIVQPTITSTVANSKIKLNDFEAYLMRYKNANITTSTDSIVWNSTYPSIWVFDGTYWQCAGNVYDSNTTYSVMSVAEGTTGTATSSRVMRADYLKQIIAGSSVGSLVDQNNTSVGIKTWTGTKAEYDALETKDPNTLYNITDDTDTSLDLLKTIYPVGSLYLTTNEVCPLANLFGQWELVSQDRVLQGAGSRGAVGTTINESLPNIKGSFSGQMINDGEGTAFADGCFEVGGSQQYSTPNCNIDGSTKGYNLNASRSSSAYQDNAPVQQNAYLINVFRRIV